MILAGRRLNDGMGAYVVSQLIKQMVMKRIQVYGANVLVLGLTFKENCPDLRNTRVVDVVSELKEYNVNVDVFDPWCSDNEAMQQHGIELIAAPQDNFYDGIVIAVAHDQFKSLGAASIRQLGKAEHILYDLKYVLEKRDVDIRL